MTVSLASPSIQTSAALGPGDAAVLDASQRANTTLRSVPVQAAGTTLVEADSGRPLTPRDYSGRFKQGSRPAVTRW